MFKSEKSFCKKLENLMEEYPKDKFTFRDIYFDLKSDKAQANKKFGFYLLTTWSLIYYKTCTTGPLTLFRQYGRIFGTHRIFRHYLYSLALCGVFAYGSFYKSIKETEMKIDEVIQTRVENDDGYIKPKKPMRYLASY